MITIHTVTNEQIGALEKHAIASANVSLALDCRAAIEGDIYATARVCNALNEPAPKAKRAK